ncbi:MAG TPA: hypothetical protein DDY38_10390 [Firmicutes bacterium]|nr:hypothetical protein [Bacillota bacterium]
MAVTCVGGVGRYFFKILGYFFCQFLLESFFVKQVPKIGLHKIASSRYYFAHFFLAYVDIFLVWQLTFGGETIKLFL